MLAQAGLSREDSSKIYNLTVIACAVELISGKVPPEVLPEQSCEHPTFGRQS